MAASHGPSSGPSPSLYADRVRVYPRAVGGPVRLAKWAVLVVLIGMVVVIGVYPGPWIDLLRPAAEAWAAGLSR